MTSGSIQPFLDWISSHPGWSGFAVFLISLSESLAIVGLLVPGVVMMTAIGSMMGAGILPFWTTLLWAILGAIAGDGISYWLGYHYHERLRGFWPFRQFPKMLARGEAFFKNHGGKSIVFGRFVGPVRPMIPVIAGMMDMTPRRFLFFNVLSAVAWAPLYSLPGILIGVSLGSLSPEVASRAGLLVLLLLLGIWIIYEILFFIGASILSTLYRLLNMIWQVLNKISWIKDLLKTQQGSHQGQLGLFLLFTLGVLCFHKIEFDVVNATGIAEWNEPVYQVLRALYSDKWISFFALITGIGEPNVLLWTAFAITLWLFWRHRIKAAIVWFLTINVGYMTGYFLKIYTAIPRPEGLTYVTQQFSFPSGHVLSSILVFGLSAFFVQYANLKQHRWVPFTVAILLVLIVLTSRLYLGMHWFTDILGSLTLGTAFVALGAFIFRRIESKSIPIRAILLPGLVVFIIMFIFYANHSYPKVRKNLQRQWTIHELDQATWWQGEGESKGLYRTGAFKHQATVFDIQWLGELGTIQNHLEEMGWTPIPKLSFKTSIMMLADESSPLQFPVMPKFHRDRLPVIRLAKQIDSQHRLVLQLWQSDFITTHHVPLWVATIRLEEANHPLPLVTVYRESSLKNQILQDFQSELMKDHHVNTHIIKIKNAVSHKVLLIKPR